MATTLRGSFKGAQQTGDDVVKPPGGGVVNPTGDGDVQTGKSKLAKNDDKRRSNATTNKAGATPGLAVPSPARGGGVGPTALRKRSWRGEGKVKGSFKGPPFVSFRSFFLDCLGLLGGVWWLFGGVLVHFLVVFRRRPFFSALLRQCPASMVEINSKITLF